ncbi:squalene desaturase [Listeria floridensis FSL S10-1187]|uniref:Squalene desaturase n=1 Tax=Listeria floridensis FSL S10-1187 TaxID=1265817 RepID=A0ABN0REF5_9LIST|nr:phytoene/squalene synthase family protein [Listeria floridensis]EUJ31261.1 squalene desaturase [Listeria floridensis FSL S10-1187]
MLSTIYHKKKKQSIWAIYAFCRQVDDSIDLEKDANKLKILRKVIVTLFENGDKSSEIEHTRLNYALRDTLQKFSFQEAPFLTLIDTVKQDLAFQQPETETELMNYCYGAAGTVGEMLLPILARENLELARQSAISLGQAMQLTNILRDVGEDFFEGRIYFSKEKMREFDVDLYKVLQGDNKENYIQLWEYYAEQANHLYQKALQGINLFDSDSQFVIQLAARIYGGILDEVRENNYTLKKRVKVSFLKKKQIFKEIQANKVYSK